MKNPNDTGKTTKDIIMGRVGVAVEALYNLDIALSNHFTGNPKHPNDIAVHAVRKRLQLAMRVLRVTDLLTLADGVDEGPKFKITQSLKQTVHGYTVEFDSCGAGDTSGTFKENEDHSEGEKEYNLMMDGVESLLVALACAGVPIDSDAVQEAVQTTLQACAHETDFDSEEE